VRHTLQMNFQTNSKTDAYFFVGAHLRGRPS
jgi:hypothetical protein